MKDNNKPKRKGAGCLIVVMVIFVVLAVGGGIGWSFISKEHNEAANVTLDAIDFGGLNDGKYHGVYEGGMYKWRVNECDVTVKDGKVVDIQLVGSQDPGAENTEYEILYDRVTKAQSLNVDTISGATLTSKAYLKAVENALLQASQ